MSDFQWTSEFIVALVVIFVLAALTMPAGIGGGILFVPVLRIIAQFTQSEASSLSQVLITGAASGSILFQILWQLKHKQEPLLAQPYFVVLMMPPLLSGSLIGVFLNNLLPDLVSLIVLVCLCVASSILIFSKGIAIYRRENVQLAARKELLRVTSVASLNGSITPPVPESLERGVSLLSLEAGINVMPEVGMYEDTIEAPSQSFMYEDPETNNIESSMSVQSLRRRIRSSRSVESIAPPNVKHPHTEAKGQFMCLTTKSVASFVIFVISYWLLLILFTILRGSKSNPSISGVSPCGLLYWLLTGCQMVMGLILALIIAYTEVKIIVLTFLAGIVSTVSGASGGILLNPMLLTRGLDPQETSATTTIIMFVMASCSALEFVMAGKVPKVLISTMGITFVGSVIGMTVITWLIRRLGRQSILVLLLGALVVIGGILLVYLGITDIVSNLRDNINPFEFGELC